MGNPWNRTNVDFFDSIDTEEKSYWAGFLYADGHVHKDGRHLFCELQGRDEGHLLKLASLFGRTLYRRVRNQRGEEKEYVILSMGSKKLVQALMILGFQNDKMKDSGEILEKIRKDLKRHFVRGYFDGDGTIGEYFSRGDWRPQIHFLGSRQFIERLQCLIGSDAGVPTHKIHSQVGPHVSIQWQAVEDVEKLMSWMYEGATVWLERKRMVMNSI